MRQKKWGIVFICLLIGLLSLTSVSANTIKGIPFTVKGNVKLSEVDIFPFYIGNDKISMQLMSHSYVYVYINDELIKVDDIKHKNCHRSGCSSSREWTTSGHRAGDNGFYTIHLKKPLGKGDVVTFRFSDDGNIPFGILVYEDEQSATERLQNERHLEEQEYAEKLFRQSILDENNKTWYGTASDFFQDTWWNVTGWWYQ